MLKIRTVGTHHKLYISETVTFGSSKAEDIGNDITSVKPCFQHLELFRFQKPKKMLQIAACGTLQKLQPGTIYGVELQIRQTTGGCRYALQISALDRRRCCTSLHFQQLQILQVTKLDILKGCKDCNLAASEIVALRTQSPQLVRVAKTVSYNTRISSMLPHRSSCKVVKQCTATLKTGMVHPNLRRWGFPRICFLVDNSACSLTPQNLSSGRPHV